MNLMWIFRNKWRVAALGKSRSRLVFMRFLAYSRKGPFALKREGVRASVMFINLILFYSMISSFYIIFLAILPSDISPLSIFLSFMV